MFRNFADLQRQKNRSGFQRHHGENEVSVNHDVARRRAHVLSQLPAYYRKEEDEKTNSTHLGDGRHTLGDSRIEKDHDFARLNHDLVISDPYEDAKTDPVLRKNLHLRRSMKRPGLGVNEVKRPDPRRLVSNERRLAMPPSKVEYVDSDNARQEYNMKTLLADRDPNWQPAPRGPLYVRKQDVFLPVGAERVIQQLSHAPIKQKKVNALRPVAGESIPDSQMGHTMGTNPDMMRHKPKTIDRESAFAKESYKDLYRPKVDLDFDPIQAEVLGLVDGEDRPVLEGPSVDIEHRPVVQYRYLGEIQNPAQFVDGNQTIDGIEMETMTRLIDKQRAGQFEERDFAEQPELDTDQESSVARFRHIPEQREVIVKEGNQIFAIDMETGSKRPLREQREFSERNTHDAPEHDIQLEVTRATLARNPTEFHRRGTAPELPRSELDIHADTRITAKATGTRQMIPREVVEGNNREFVTIDRHGFKRLGNIEQKKVEFKTDPGTDFDIGIESAGQRRRGTLEQRQVIYNESLSGETEREAVPFRRRKTITEESFRDRDQDIAPKLEVSGRQFKVISRSQLQENPIDIASAPRADISGKDRVRSPRTDNVEDRPLHIREAPRTDANVRERISTRTEGLRQGDPRMTEQHKNPDMNLPHDHQVKQVFLKQQPPRIVEEYPKPDWENPDLVTEQRQRLKVRGITAQTRPKPLDPVAPPDLDYPGSKPSTPRAHQNTSRPSTPRSTPSRKHNDDFERAIRFGLVPQPFK